MKAFYTHLYINNYKKIDKHEMFINLWFCVQTLISFQLLISCLVNVVDTHWTIPQLDKVLNWKTILARLERASKI